MPRITVGAAAPVTKAWNCEWCGRMEDAAKQKCPKCGTKRQRCSRYEWFLADALEKVLEQSGRDYTIQEQWEMPDHRGFVWYYDLAVWVRGKGFHQGYTFLIEVNGADHDAERGSARDADKEWEFGARGLHKKGYVVEVVRNEDCRMKVVQQTAERIAAEIMQWADQ